MQPDRVIQAAQARVQWADLLSRVCFAGERVLIVRRGREVAALVPAGDLALLRHLADAADIAAARKALDLSKGRPEAAWAGTRSTGEFAMWFGMLGRREQSELARAIDLAAVEGAERVGGTRSLYRLRAAGWRVLFMRNDAGMTLIALEREDPRDPEPDD